jgi:hypothetical protein
MGTSNQRAYPIWTYDTSDLRLQLYTKLNAEAEIAMPTQSEAAGLEPLPHLAYLKPWAKELYFTYGDIEMILDRLVRLFQARSDIPYTETKAMGWAGPNEEKLQIDRLMQQGRVEAVDETDELASHSAMWFPDNTLFEEIIRKQVWQNYLSTVGFGIY